MIAFYPFYDPVVCEWKEVNMVGLHFDIVPTDLIDYNGISKASRYSRLSTILYPCGVPIYKIPKH